MRWTHCLTAVWEGGAACSALFESQKRFGMGRREAIGNNPLVALLLAV